MKRTLTLLAILAAIGPAWGAEVVSSNIVGYNRVTLNAGYNMLGSNFKLVGGDDGTLTEVCDASALPGLDVNAGTFKAEVLLWTGSGYTTYGWAGEVGDAELDNQWLDEGNWGAVTVDADNGMGFWITTTASADVVFSGEVPNSDTITLDLATGYNMIGNPFPETISIQSITSTDLEGLDVTTGTFASEILLWTGSGYKTYGWSGEVGDAELDNKWLDEGTWGPVEENLPIGMGCWIKSSRPAHVTFTK